MNNSTDLIYSTVDQLLAQYSGSTLIIDYFCFYGFVLVGLIGFLLNVFSFAIFMNAEFNIPLYSYLRVYTVDNAIICLLSIFYFTSNSSRLFSWTNSWPSQVYYVYVYMNLSNVCYFFGGTLDICILLDRIAYFNKRMSVFCKKPPYLISSVLLIACFLIDSPIYFQNSSVVKSSKLNVSFEYSVFFTQTSQFGKSIFGEILIYLVYILRDVTIFIVQLALNLTAIVLLRRFLKKKMLSVGALVLATNNSTSLLSKPAVTVSKHHHIDSVAFVGSIKNRDSIMPVSTIFSTGTSISIASTRTANQVSRADLNATMMAWTMSLLSVCERALSLLNSIYPLLYMNLDTFILYDVNDFFWAFRRLLQPFIFYIFNANFRRVLNERIRIILKSFK